MQGDWIKFHTTLWLKYLPSVCVFEGVTELSNKVSVERNKGKPYAMALLVLCIAAKWRKGKYNEGDEYL